MRLPGVPVRHYGAPCTTVQCHHVSHGQWPHSQATAAATVQPVHLVQDKQPSSPSKNLARVVVWKDVRQERGAHLDSRTQPLCRPPVSTPGHTIAQHSRPNSLKDTDLALTEAEVGAPTPAVAHLTHRMDARLQEVHELLRMGEEAISGNVEVCADISSPSRCSSSESEAGESRANRACSEWKELSVTGDRFMLSLTERLHALAEDKMSISACSTRDSFSADSPMNLQDDATSEHSTQSRPSSDVGLQGVLQTISMEGLASKMERAREGKEVQALREQVRTLQGALRSSQQECERAQSEKRHLQQELTKMRTQTHRGGSDQPVFNEVFVDKFLEAMRG